MRQVNEGQRSTKVNLYLNKNSQQKSIQAEEGQLVCHSTLPFSFLTSAVLSIASCSLPLRFPSLSHSSPHFLCFGSIYYNHRYSLWQPSSHQLRWFLMSTSTSSQGVSSSPPSTSLYVPTPSYSSPDIINQQ